MNYEIIVYQNKNHKLPFYDWLEGLDINNRQKIRMKIERLRLGNFSNCKSIGSGIFELKIDFGPGYRVYFSKLGSSKILILFGGIKRIQQRDIEKSKEYLKDFKAR